MPKLTTRPSSNEHKLVNQLRRKLRIKTLDEVQTDTIQMALKRTHGDKALSADLVGMAKTTFYRFLRRGSKPAKKRPPKPKMPIVQLRRKLGLKTIAESTHDVIQKALQRTGGSMDLSAKLLGIGKTTIYRHLAKKATKRS